jgi:hypothetical protein
MPTAWQTETTAAHARSSDRRAEYVTSLSYFRVYVRFMTLKAALMSDASGGDPQRMEPPRGTVASLLLTPDLRITSRPRHTVPRGVGWICPHGSPLWSEVVVQSTSLRRSIVAAILIQYDAS